MKWSLGIVLVTSDRFFYYYQGDSHVGVYCWSHFGSFSSGLRNWSKSEVNLTTNNTVMVFVQNTEEILR